MAKKILRSYKVTAIGPESKITFYVHDCPSKQVAIHRVRRDKNKLALLERERIYKVDEKRIVVERV